MNTTLPLQVLERRSDLGRHARGRRRADSIALLGPGLACGMLTSAISVRDDLSEQIDRRRQDIVAELPRRVPGPVHEGGEPNLGQHRCVSGQNLQPPGGHTVCSSISQPHRGYRPHDEQPLHGAALG
ncbi:hypothetical protein AB0D13_33355 [Streptomyces sp. NPDC048430]|uniref:hypothetical protein n=1 Tax=Streptomyces sp. NPDC048430 TaxID=3155388 RepID=UPI00343CFE61